MSQKQFIKTDGDFNLITFKMSYIQAIEALKNENTPIETLLDCIVNLSIDHGYILACVKFGRRTNAEADILRIVALSRVLRVQILTRLVEMAGARSIGYDRSVVKYLKRKAQQPRAVTHG